VSDNFGVQTYIDAALEISKSGRWNALNEFIKKLADNPAQYGIWRTEVFGKLSYRTFLEFRELKLASEKDGDQISTIAWHARNLLEICVWAIYCTKSEENAKAFYEDAGKDGLDLIERLKKWGEETGQNEDWLNLCSNGMEDLKNNSKLRQIKLSDSSFTKVHDAAQKVGLISNFNISNKILSKFTHPTAFLIISQFDDGVMQELKTGLYGKGCVYFTEAFNCLEQHAVAIKEEFFAIA
jgi:hypothetical protein